jgi:hypothetical protein
MYDNGMNSNAAFTSSSSNIAAGGGGAVNSNTGDNGGEGSARDRNGGMVSKRLTAATLNNRNTNRYSVTALYSMAAEQDVEVEDDLARGA